MHRRPPRVAVAIAPHLVGSAVAAFLSLDGRLEPVLVDVAATDLAIVAAGVDAIVASHTLAGVPAHVLQVVLAGDPLRVRIDGPVALTSGPYLGLDELTDRLAEALGVAPAAERKLFGVP